jgi:hypothetical protein
MPSSSLRTARRARLRPSHRRWLRFAALSTFAMVGCADGLLQSDRVPSELQLDSDDVLATEGDRLEIRVTVLDQHGQPYAQLPHFGLPQWSISYQDIARQDGPAIAAVGPGQTPATPPPHRPVP